MLGNKVVDFIGENCTIRQGPAIGTKFKVLPWQRKFIRHTFDDDGSLFALSVARGAGKSTLIAGVGCAALSGPAAQPGSDILIIASNFKQGGNIFRHVNWFLEAAVEADPKRYRIQNSTGVQEVHDKATDTRLIVLPFSSSGIHGYAPSLALCDELARWQASQIDETLASIETGLGKTGHGRMVCIGTQADVEEHPWAKILSTRADYAQLHCAGEDDPMFRATTWIKANPSLRYMPHLLAETRRYAQRAKKDENLIPAFRNLRLNLLGSDHMESFLLEVATWRRIEGDAPATGPFILGIDAGTTASLSAAVAYWMDTGRADGFAVLPIKPSLEDKQQNEGAGRIYTSMAARGELIQRGEYVADLKALLQEAVRRYGEPVAICIDRWREGDVREALSAVSLPMTSIILRGQGFYHGGEDVRLTRRAALSGELTPVPNLGLRSGVTGARVVRDPAGNEKLSKTTKRIRDDFASALMLAVGEGQRRRRARPTRQLLSYTKIR